MPGKLPKNIFIGKDANRTELLLDGNADKKIDLFFFSEKRKEKMQQNANILICRLLQGSFFVEEPSYKNKHFFKDDVFLRPQEIN